MIRLGESSFRKSSHSVEKACVEVGSQTATTVGVRDSKIDDSPVFTVAPSAWSAFLTLARTAR